MIQPRILCLPKCPPSQLGDEAVALSAEQGLKLDDWQAESLRWSLRQKKNGELAASDVGCCVPRQNGKGVLVTARMLAGVVLLKEEMQTYSAHLFDTSLEAFRRLVGYIEETDLEREIKRNKHGGLLIKYSHGEEGIEFRGNRRIRFRTRTKGGGRGFTGDTLYIDEAMYFSEWQQDALLYTLSTRKGQMWLLGSAVDQESHEHGVVFARLRERAIRGEKELAYFEWSLEADHPTLVAPEDVADPAAWAKSNPALGVRIRQQAVEREYRATQGGRGFVVERLNVGDWPRTDHIADSIINLEQYLELRDDRSKLADPFVLAFDVSPDRRASIAAAGANLQGLWHWEVIENKEGTAWLPARIKELDEKQRPVAIVCDGYGPVQSIVAAVEEAGVKVIQVTAAEHAQACGRFVDVIQQRSGRHLGSSELTGAIRGAKSRPLGDAWAWSRRNSDVDISPLVAATLALSAAIEGRARSVYDDRGLIAL